MADPKNPGVRRSYQELFLISFLLLFFELACIRWFGSYVIFLTFFTNVVLLGSFVGMSVGCLAASRRTNFINWTPLVCLIAVVSALGIIYLYQTDHSITVDIGHQYSPDRVYFGTSWRHTDPNTSGIPIELIAGYFFLLVVLMFVGLGQVLGRRFDAIPNRILAYSTNLLGSLAGIVGFGVVSYRWLSPFWWFLIGLGGCCYFARGSLKTRLFTWGFALNTFILVGIAGLGLFNQLLEGPGKREVHWSPYYRIDYRPKSLDISVNGIGHQGMKKIATHKGDYFIPHLLSQAIQDSAKSQEPFEVLVIGAGSGNDVAAALWGGADRVDAVEIDPIIHRLGRRHHPDKPFDDKRVHVHVNDGRNFLKQTDRKYDMVIYALVDSLILHSGYSSLRLENFLFTQEAFEDVRHCLKDDGMFVMYNYYRQGWVAGRLTRMARETFGGHEPVVLQLNEAGESVLEIKENTKGGFTMLFARNDNKLSDAFKNQGLFWIHPRDFKNPLTGFGATAPAAAEGQIRWQGLRPAKVIESESAKQVPRDSWPFLYTREKKIPAFTRNGMLIMGGIAALLVILFTPKRAAARFHWTLFFLGAGFMLLETKSVVHLALLFGSTWKVNSIVFFAILVMTLAANLFVLRFHPKRLAPWYIALIASLILNIFIGPEVFLGMTNAFKYIGSGLVVFIPIFFAGIIFASGFRDAEHPDQAFGANIAGIVLGGLAENFSVVLGFKHLLWIAVAFYLFARLFQRRTASV